MIARRAAFDASLHDAAFDASPRCAACRFFCADSQELESRIAGLRSFGSGFASVRAGDGLCEKHDRYLSASAHCPSFDRRLPLAANAS